MERRVHLRKLARPGVPEQVRAHIRSTDRKLLTRLLSIEIAEECQFVELRSDLVETAVDSHELPAVRELAADAVASIGLADDADAVGRFRALLSTSAEEDPKDELFGAALKAL